MSRIAGRSIALLVSLIVVVCLAGASAAAADPTGSVVGYQAHVEDIGWQPFVYDGAVAGTTGRSLRMEAISIHVNTSWFAPGYYPGAGICYAAYLQDTAWQAPVCNGAVAGTTGQSRRMEAVWIALQNMPGWHVCYSVHQENYGWLPYECDGRSIGITGQSLRLEAIEIVLAYQEPPPGYGWLWYGHFAAPAPGCQPYSSGPC